MSGVVKAVGKVFKPVVKLVKKIAPIALGIGALVMTGGAALGAMPAWGSAISGLTGSLGLGSTMTGVLTGAVTQAGYGAAIGGLTSAVTGGNVLKGMKGGAVTGAITGGLMGGMGFETDPLKGLGKEGAESAAADGLSEISISATRRPESVLSATSGGQAAAASSAGGAAPGFLEAGGWLERNQELASGLIGGVGSGITAHMDNQFVKKENQRQRDWITDNYQTSGRGLLNAGSTDYIHRQPQRPTPEQRYDPRTYGGRYIYSPEQGRVVFVPNNQMA